MKPRNGAILALVFLATCSEETRTPPSLESTRAALGVSPPSEVAVWEKAGSTTTPEGRYLQAAAYDESRKVVVMFGGMIFDNYTWMGKPNNETWEWDPATGGWQRRAQDGAAPDARSGAAMVFDPKRNKLVLFGGRAGSGYNFEDTWELDPASGVWTNVSGAGSRPSARSQHGMVYQRSSGKILLFGGGRSDPYASDGVGVSVSLGDVWELDPETHVWTPLPAAGPSARHDFGMVWDDARSRAVVFGGMQSDIAGASGVPKQDTWEYDPATGAWSERTLAGAKPSQRYAHAMAFDGSRKRVVLFGGWDISTGYFLNDLWDWEPESGAWSQRLADGNASGPSGRMYASLVSVEGSARLELVAGAVVNDPFGSGGMVPPPMGYYGFTGSRDVWELDPATATFLNRTEPLGVPSARNNQAMAYDPVSQLTYLFGGYELQRGLPLDDLWAWDGKTWTQVTTTTRPPGRGDAALAFDPERQSLILFGGVDYSYGRYFDDTWEWSKAGGWKQLRTEGSPGALAGHGMVSDPARRKVLLFGGMSDKYWYYGPDGGTGPMRDPMRNEVWEWDGAKQSWTNRTPTSSALVPVGRQHPTLAFDEARGKLFLLDGYNYNYNTGASSSSYWEWDTTSAGWSLRDPGDWLAMSYNLFAVYDPIRHRQVVVTDTGSYSGGTDETWELDGRTATWYVRTPSGGPGSRYGASTTFDSKRGVLVLFGGVNQMTGMPANDTWEYRVTGWGNGTGCTADFAGWCASGNCVDGVCCDAAACTGPCRSCAEGTCQPAKAGTEVPGSCTNGQACDGDGNCMSSNGQACTSAASCASGFCADGVCCDSACQGACVACANPGRVGRCTPHAAGSDPDKDCGKGTGVCASTCDGVGACVFPATSKPCDTCMVCDGAGTCNTYDPYCGFPGTGGFGGFGGSGGYATSRGGSGGYTTVRGGSGGFTTARGGSGGFTTARGGSGGFTTARGGSGGNTTARGGSGGFTTARGGSGGKADGGPMGGSSWPGTDDDLITNARLHRSGCSCALGETQSGGAGAAVPLGVGLALFVALRRHRRRPRS